FTYCSSDPRDLHSFPTRRSSDLGALRRGVIAGGGEDLKTAVVPGALEERAHVDLALALPRHDAGPGGRAVLTCANRDGEALGPRSEEHTSELQSRGHLVCRLLLE